VATSTDRLTVREVKCFLCGYLLGELLSGPQYRLFRRAPGCPPLGVTRPERARCPRCNGPVYLEGAETTTEWALHLGRGSHPARHN
jgi:hypothetical protein